MIAEKPAKFGRRAMGEIAKDWVDRRHYDFLVSLPRLADGGRRSEAEIQTLRQQLAKRLTLDYKPWAMQPRDITF